MPGPLPKHPELRQRRNKSASRAILPAESSPITSRPRLPANPDEEGWHPMAKRWWRDVWDSPVRHEFMRADLGSLFRLVDMVDAYWKSRSLALAKEIRMMEREFGLTPMARRRLEWQVAQSEEAKDKHQVRRARRARVVSGDDAREVLAG